MKVFGYEYSSDRLLKLQEVTIQASAAELRAIAGFLNHSADLMDKHGAAYGHEHYRDWIGGGTVPACDLIVANPKLGAEKQ